VLPKSGPCMLQPMRPSINRVMCAGSPTNQRRDQKSLRQKIHAARPTITASNPSEVPRM